MALISAITRPHPSTSKTKTPHLQGCSQQDLWEPRSAASIHETSTKQAKLSPKRPQLILVSALGKAFVTSSFENLREIVRNISLTPFGLLSFNTELDQRIMRVGRDHWRCSPSINGSKLTSILPSATVHSTDKCWEQGVLCEEHPGLKVNALIRLPESKKPVAGSLLLALRISKEQHMGLLRLEEGKERTAAAFQQPILDYFTINMQIEKQGMHQGCNNMLQAGSCGTTDHLSCRSSTQDSRIRHFFIAHVQLWHRASA